MSKLKTSKLRNDLGSLLKSSYLPQKEAAKKMAKDGYTLDPQLSTMSSKVFVSPTGKPVITHRGTTTVKDVIDDSLLALGLGKYGFKYKGAQRLTKKVEDKYKQAADVVGHSYGGWLAENSGAHGNIVTMNKAVGLGDIGKKKNSLRQLDVMTKGDLVSALGATQNANKEVVENRFKSKDPFKNALNAHGTDNLFGAREQPDATATMFPDAKTS